MFEVYFSHNTALVQKHTFKTTPCSLTTANHMSKCAATWTLNDPHAQLINCTICCNYSQLITN